MPESAVTGDGTTGADRAGAAEAASARSAALAFVRQGAGFAQLTTIDAHGYPVVRSVIAFLEPDWSVTLIQRRRHHRIRQWRHNARTLVSWTGDPVTGAVNEHPHVFDVGLLPPRQVSVRGDAEFQDDGWTWQQYLSHLEGQRARGLTRAPVRTEEDVRRELVGVRVRPVRVRLEGFLGDPRDISWSVGPLGTTSARQ